jgi:hypothetical protein
MMAISEGPAKTSIPTWPNSIRFASATNLLPGPTMMSAGRPVNSPCAIAAIACTPPSVMIDVGAGDVHRVEHLGMDAVVAAVAAVRRRARDHRRHARRLRRGDAHVRRRDVRVAAGRHVAARDVDGNEPLAGGKPG